MGSTLPNRSAEGVPRRHIELYEELCQRLQDKWNPGGPKLTPFDGWVEDTVVLDSIVNEGGMDEVRVIIHNCCDGDGYFWSCGGWYRREDYTITKDNKTGHGPWELETAWSFGGDGGPRMRIFWQNEDGLLEDDV